MNKEIKAYEDFDKIVNNESGLVAVAINIPKNAIPKLSKFFYLPQQFKYNYAKNNHMSIL